MGQGSSTSYELSLSKTPSDALGAVGAGGSSRMGVGALIISVQVSCEDGRCLRLDAGRIPRLCISISARPVPRLVAVLADVVAGVPFGPSGPSGSAPCGVPTDRRCWGERHEAGDDDRHHVMNCPPAPRTSMKRYVRTFW